MITVLLLLAVCACVTAFMAAMGKCQIWVPVVLLCLWVLLKSLPVG